MDHNPYLNEDKEGTLNGTLPLTENWSVHGGVWRNFELNEFVSGNSGIVYKNECFNITFDATRVFSHDRDVQPVTQYLLRIAFKHLGEFGGQ